MTEVRIILATFAELKLLFMRKILLFAFALGILGACKKETTSVDYSATDKAIIEKFIADSGYVAQSTPEGVYYTIDIPGTSGHPTVSSTVKVHYKGYLTDGTVFDKTSGTAVTFPLSGVIMGWQIGIPKFGKGGKGKLFIPSDLGYAENTTGNIPPHSVLIFDIVVSDFY